MWSEANLSIVGGMCMNILIIGNGFDLAHGLPTTYKDFLKFTDKFEEYRLGNEDGDELLQDDDGSSDYFFNLFGNKANKNVRDLIQELSALIKNNVWIKYFKNLCENRTEQGKDGWIDFESEISHIIQTLDSASHTIAEQVAQGQKNGKMTQYQYSILRPVIGQKWSSEKYDSISFENKVIRYKKELLLKDLNKLIRCLEIYLSDYVSNLRVDKLLPDIKKLPFINKVLSFNYTSTYENYYSEFPYEIDYTHGKAAIENTMDTNNMVLGIDEYLKGDEKNENTEFIEFKKYFQRIHKETGSLYKLWLNKMEEQEQIKEITSVQKDNDGTISYVEEYATCHNVFFFGHSLDVTDRDIIREFILADRVQTTIFYVDRTDYGKKITNLVKVIGQDELIRRTGGKTKTITFQKITKEV